MTKEIIYCDICDKAILPENLNFITVKGKIYFGHICLGEKNYYDENDICPECFTKLLRAWDKVKEGVKEKKNDRTKSNRSTRARN